MFQKLIKSMAAKQHLNFLTHDNGVKVIECSSACKGSSAEHVLQNTRKVVHSQSESLAIRAGIPAVSYIRPDRDEEET